MESTLVYGAFADEEKTEAVVDKLHAAGLNTDQICVVANRGDVFKYVSARVQDPSGRYFLLFGIIGCICGLLAGLAGAPRLNYTVGFQIMVPLMAAISGGAAFAYFGCWICAFFLANQKDHWANVLQAEMEAVPVIVMAEPDSPDQLTAATEALIANDPEELVVHGNHAAMALISRSWQGNAEQDKGTSAEEIQPEMSRVA